MGVGIDPQPANEFLQVGARHRGAACSDPSRAASCVEEDGAARSRLNGFRIVADFNQIGISDIAEPHALLLKPGRWIVRILKNVVLVVVSILWVVDPSISPRDLMVVVIGARWKSLRIP